jgi:dihydroorotate dehydrogenase
MPLEKLIIGAPFGNWLRRPGVTSTLGTYTLQRRAGFFKRWWRVLKTVRYYRRPQAWINKLGLPSPGIWSLTQEKAAGNKILSIHGFTPDEWETLASQAGTLGVQAVELNVSCPNVGSAVSEVMAGALAAVRLYSRWHKARGGHPLLIVKLPPLRWLDIAARFIDVGVTHFHACNTLPTPGGGLSGKPLKQLSLWAIEEIRRHSFHPHLTLIGGGGITTTQDIDDYLSAGANHVAIASVLLNPFNWRKIKVFRDHLHGKC